MTDILLDENFDLRIENGDFVVGESAGQEAKLLLLYAPGNLRPDPLIGVGIKRWLNSAMTGAGKRALDKSVYLEFDADNKSVNTVEYVVGTDNELLDVVVDFDS